MDILPLLKWSKQLEVKTWNHSFHNADISAANDYPKKIDSCPQHLQLLYRLLSELEQSPSESTSSTAVQHQSMLLLRPTKQSKHQTFTVRKNPTEGVYSFFPDIPQLYPHYKYHPSISARLVFFKVRTCYFLPYTDKQVSTIECKPNISQQLYKLDKNLKIISQFSLPLHLPRHTQLFIVDVLILEYEVLTQASIMPIQDIKRVSQPLEFIFN